MIKVTNVDKYCVIKMLKVFQTYSQLIFKHLLTYLTSCFYLLNHSFQHKSQYINIISYKGEKL